MLSVAACLWIVTRPAHAHTSALVDWIVMVAAMMLPLVFDHLQYAATRSLWRRRQRAVIGFFCGYIAVWMLGGVAALAAAPLLTVPLAVAIAFLWQLTPWKRRALIACHATMPLAPDGWRADRDCVRYGWSIGSACVVTCGAMMLACAVIGHSLPAMVVVTMIAAAERGRLRWPSYPRLRSSRSLSLTPQLPSDTGWPH
jgi:predicted metal-binding membrane protein